MARDSDYPSVSHPASTPAENGDNGAPAEDPLVELARIVNRNKQPGDSVSSDRVGTTDYFAGLDDFDVSPAQPTREEPSFDTLTSAPAGQEPRMEPHFGFSRGESTPPEETYQDPAYQDAGYPGEGHSAYSYPDEGFAGSSDEYGSEADSAPIASNDASTGSRFEPNFDLMDLRGDSHSAPEVAAETASYEEERSSGGDFELHFENELIGAFHSSIGSTRQEPTFGGAEQPEAEVEPEYVAETESEAEPEVAADYGYSASVSDYREPETAEAPASEKTSAYSAASYDYFGGETRAYDTAFDNVDADAGAGAGVAAEASSHGADEVSVEDYREPDYGGYSSDTSSYYGNETAYEEEAADNADLSYDHSYSASGHLTEEASEPSSGDLSGLRLSVEDDHAGADLVAGGLEEELFAALDRNTDGRRRSSTPEWQVEPEPVAEAAAETPETTDQADPNSFDALFAELEQSRKPQTPSEPLQGGFGGQSAGDAYDLTGAFSEETESAGYQSASYQSAGSSVSSNIDDMAWPAAASALSDHGDEELPPPGGYDLDAVARAMQESDPTIGRSGVLPPHPPAEEAVIPHQDGGRKRGKLVAAGVLAVAVIGAGGYLLVSDGGSLSVPDGPPPVIAGLEGPLKVYPDPKQEEDDSGSKLIYDRVGGTDDTSRERLVLPENTKPAELPPAPADSTSGDTLLRGGPKKVRTLVVRPDGTIVSASDDSGASSSTLTAPSGNEATSNQQAALTSPISGNETATSESGQVEANVVETQPITAGEAPAASTEATELPPQVNVPDVLPPKKPAVPTQVASAPIAAQPAPVASQPRSVVNSGPLDLSNPQTTAPAASTSAPAVVSTGGSIPAGTYVVQVTSQRSEEAARSSYSDLQRRFPAILGNRQAVIVAAQIDDRGTFYRARIPMGSRDDALSLCESLQSAGGDCFVRRN